MGLSVNRPERGLEAFFLGEGGFIKAGNSTKPSPAYSRERETHGGVGLSGGLPHTPGSFSTLPPASSVSEAASSRPSVALAPVKGQEGPLLTLRQSRSFLPPEAEMTRIL